MKKVLFLSILAVLGLTACSNATKEKLGLSKQAPNEMMVMSRAPLTLPPEYNLRPVDGMETSPVVDMTDKLDGMSRGEQKLMSNINAQDTDDDIRSKIDKELEDLKK